MYQIKEEDVNGIAKGLEEYYQIAWEEGVHSLFNDMARSNMGFFTAAGDKVKDSYLNLRKPSVDSLTVTLKPLLAKEISRYTSNGYNVAQDLTILATMALSGLASYIPIPGLGTCVSKVINIVGKEIGDELHRNAINKDDTTLMEKNKSDLDEKMRTLFTDDIAAKDAVIAAMQQYQLICNYIREMPSEIKDFDDAITMPASTFKVQKASSKLNIQLRNINQYLMAMEERLLKIQSVSEIYIETIRNEMPMAVKNVLNEAYRSSQHKASTDRYEGKPSAILAKPILFAPNKNEGAATKLAAYLSHAIALGYWDAYPSEVKSIDGSSVEKTALIWQSDKDVSECTCCKTEFGTFTRRHHCRMCGRVFCDECTPKNDSGIRVCLLCVPTGNFKKIMSKSIFF